MCCGTLRQPISRGFLARSAARAAVAAHPRGTAVAPSSHSRAASGVEFEYGGATALTVVSPLTGKTYLFPVPACASR